MLNRLPHFGGDLFKEKKKIMLNQKEYKLSELVKGLDVTIKGDPDCMITGVSPVQKAEAGHITFLTNSQYRKYLPLTKAAAVILSEKDADECNVNAVISPNPYFIYAKVAGFFDLSPKTDATGVHESVVIGEGTVIDPAASIAAHCSIGRNVKIAAGAHIAPGCAIDDDVVIGEDTHIDPNVTVYHGVKIGKRCRISSGVVIGSDGFGFAVQKGVWHKVPQLGAVTIGNDVEIGSGTTIDRGAVEDTVIEDGVKLDNLIQVGHNVKIGAHTVVAGCVGIAGSTTIGKHCMIGGAANFAGHLTVADQVMITGMTAVTKSIREPGLYSSGIVGAVPNHEFLKNNARFHRLDSLMQRVKSLESALKEMTEKN